ncbi:MAG TPA: hypothetical protein VD978_18135 [Azospirillum sp.]|nr:hypothetical protein [Azospirillum sp.]
MILAQALETLAIVFAFAGLAAVISEIVAHDPGLLDEIVTDVRAMARPDGLPAQPTESARGVPAQGGCSR